MTASASLCPVSKNRRLDMYHNLTLRVSAARGLDSWGGIKQQNNEPNGRANQSGRLS